MKVGIVGGGQLARMMLEEASRLGIDTVVLAESPEDGAAKVCAEVLIGHPADRSAMASLASACDVITLDHELVDLEIIGDLIAAGHPVWPAPSALIYAVDKAEMRTTLSEAGLPMPRFEIVPPGSSVDLDELGQRWGWPLVLKAARGGYDGKGVFIVGDADEAASTLGELHAQGVTGLFEERVEIEAELAALVVRRPNGEIKAWPVVETAQVAGVCREVLVPGDLSAAIAEKAEAIALRVADEVAVVGVMAVELFATADGLVVNELAMRPHNSGHWTQDGASTSQFENHLRAVLDLPLGSTEMSARFVASVNVFGGSEAIALEEGLLGALDVPEAKVHLYGKASREGRKLGHVNVAGNDGSMVRRAAWKAATALGTPMPDEIRGVEL
jgi:5-(carboxyamino)imidazole ribonucleotide synthase